MISGEVVEDVTGHMLVFAWFQLTKCGSLRGSSSLVGVCLNTRVCVCDLSAHGAYVNFKISSCPFWDVVGDVKGHL